MREVADVLDLLGRAIRRSSKVKDEEKTELAERAVAIREKVIGPAHPQLATSLINLGVQRSWRAILHQQSPCSNVHLPFERPRSVRPSADRGHAAEPRRAADDAPRRCRSEVAARTGAAVSRTDARRRPSRSHSNARQSGDRVSGDRRLRERGNGTSARAHSRNRSAARRPAHSPCAGGHSGRAEQLAGDPAGSARLNERLVVLTERSFGTMDRRLTAPLENLAMDFRDLGEYAAALAAGQRALAIAEQALGPNHPDVARILHTVATVLAAG